jgi:hypothetical protein
MSHGWENMVARAMQLGIAARDEMRTPLNLRSHSRCLKMPCSLAAIRGHCTMAAASRERTNSRRLSSSAVEPSTPREHGQALVSQPAYSGLCRQKETAPIPENAASQDGAQLANSEERQAPVNPVLCAVS